jgi:hypothetical protein
MEYDFTQDREDWHERFSDIQRKAALWNYSLFFPDITFKARYEDFVDVVGAPGPAARDGDGPAAPARLAAHAVVGARPVRGSAVEPP